MPFICLFHGMSERGISTQDVRGWVEPIPFLFLNTHTTEHINGGD
jgi:hypothetical protein